MAPVQSHRGALVMVAVVAVVRRRGPVSGGDAWEACMTRRRQVHDRVKASTMRKVVKEGATGSVSSAKVPPACRSLTRGLELLWQLGNGARLARRRCTRG